MDDITCKVRQTGIIRNPDGSEKKVFRIECDNNYELEITSNTLTLDQVAEALQKGKLALKQIQPIRSEIELTIQKVLKAI